ncbi:MULTISPECIES: EAL domain-containing protein [unclassified Cryobacterium]|uniref:EAL domain-containing protein n=1 Tax=unclassified Cryobacterium TaxID=2649013 RepID=UPI001F545A80|nr:MULTISPECIES: EAL domain-containing protein [unclassified Cryobacterium]
MPADRVRADRAPGDAGWDSMLAAACRGEGVSSVYQPIVDSARGVIVGYEALTRFSGYSERNPESWFAAARAHGRAEELEVLALRTALVARPTLPRNCFLTLNVSPDLLSCESVREVWRDEGDLGGLIIELTEQAPIESYLSLEPYLHEVRAAGGLIAVDDPGSGYAGLRHLLSLRPSMIKLDRALIQDLDRDEAKLALVEMVGTFAGRVDAWLLGEGVETVEELDALVALGVPLLQGYVLARPAPPWAGIDVDVALRLAARRVSSAAAVIRDVLEVVPTVESVAAAAAAFGAQPRLRSVVLIDEHHRPVAALGGGSARLGVVSQGLRVNLDTPITEALKRAMTRDETSRFDPLLATDNAGRFTGIARLERLVTAVAGSDRS